jgi:hypothetical protein
MMLVGLHWRHRHRLPEGTLLLMLLRGIGGANVVKLRIICRALVGITCGIRHASSTTNTSNASNGCIGIARRRRRGGW